MRLNADDLRRLAGEAAKAAREAGAVVQRYRARPVDVRYKEGAENPAAQVVTEVDLLSEKTIVDILRPGCERHDLALLTEEGTDDGSRLLKDYFWCVDPLDGTLAFIESRPGYSISIALVTRGGQPLIGVVFDPVKQTLYQAVNGQGIYRNGEPWSRPGLAKECEPVLTLVCDDGFTDKPGYASFYHGLESVAARHGLPGVELRRGAGAVLDACGVLENPPAVYLKFPKTGQGGGCLWDFAATAAIFQQASAAVSDIAGRPLDLNRHDSVYMNHRGVLYVSDADLAADILNIVRE